MQIRHRLTRIYRATVGHTVAMHWQRAVHLIAWRGHIRVLGHVRGSRLLVGLVLRADDRSGEWGPFRGDLLGREIERRDLPCNRADCRHSSTSRSSRTHWTGSRRSSCRCRSWVRTSQWWLTWSSVAMCRLCEGRVKGKDCENVDYQDYNCLLPPQCELLQLLHWSSTWREEFSHSEEKKHCG